MKTFDIGIYEETKYKGILVGLCEQVKGLKFVHNPNTWRMSALTLALHIHDCIILFDEVKSRWMKKLPFDEAWDVDFGYWKTELQVNLNQLDSFTTEDSYHHWEKLCDNDFHIFLNKVSKCLDGVIPINEVLDFLRDKNTELSAVIRNMVDSLARLLKEIDDIPQTAPNNNNCLLIILTS